MHLIPLIINEVLGEFLPNLRINMGVNLVLDYQQQNLVLRQKEDAQHALLLQQFELFELDPA